ncbi:porin family protein [Pseudotenacibaculum sp. MALMAid0570]|uniref:porin family protein n=1 Tax=Pseudotenacibaculum sp. MALMAid0570 TaxID=3143938 RepID=UPI0032DFEC89
MKKVLLACLLMVGISHYSQAQLQVGLKAGVNYNSDSFSNVSNDVLNGAESRTGYHAGLWFRAKLPVVGLYIRPEIVYTELANDVVYDNSTLLRTTDFKLRKIDIPVLLGKKIFGIGNVFAGPSFQYILSSDFGLNDLSEVSTDEFSLGIQLGAGIEFGRLGIDVRWERSLSKAEAKFVDNNISSNVNFDTRVNQIIFGLSYRL